MREFATPLTSSISSRQNLADDIVLHATDTPDKILLSRPVEGEWLDVTAHQAHELIRSVAGGFLAAGIVKGDRVALMAPTSFEWTVLDYALWYIGAVPVPIYETSSADQLRWILTDSGAVAAIGGTPDQAARLRAAGISDIRTVWCIDDGALDALKQHPLPVEDIERHRHAVQATDLATIIYTSGTTGHPKGCPLTHANFSFEADVAVAELGGVFREDAATLLFLPLAHVFARVIQVGAIRVGVRLGHSSDIRHLLVDLESFRPTFILAVPRALEQIFNNASQRAVADGHGRLFKSAVEAAIAWSRAVESGKGLVKHRVRRAAFDRLVYAGLRAALGGRCEVAISGGAPLGERLTHFYRGAGINVLEGYGLTETTAALTVNSLESQRVGSVGRPLPGTTARVAEDGELLFKGGQIFGGYWHDPEATAQVLDAEGWFHTGDIGEIDDEGFIRVTGRKKEILVTAGGKNVSPPALEDRIRAHWLVDQCLVVGDGQPFVAAVVTLDPEALESWREKHANTSPLSALVDDADLRAEVQKAIDESNRTVSRAESVRKFVIVPDTWAEETGELTASLKLKRNVVMAQYADEVDALYAR